MSEPHASESRDSESHNPQPEMDLSRLSVLIAQGEHPFPTTLDSKKAIDLANRVRSLRRQRLLRLVARLVARDLMLNHPRRAE